VPPNLEQSLIETPPLRFGVLGDPCTFSLKLTLAVDPKEEEPKTDKELPKDAILNKVKVVCMLTGRIKVATPHILEPPLTLKTGVKESLITGLPIHKNWPIDKDFMITCLDKTSV
jgi:hypothetical protein